MYKLTHILDIHFHGHALHCLTQISKRVYRVSPLTWNFQYYGSLPSHQQI